jgi:hypothetical protein
MDHKKLLTEFGQSAGIFIALVLFIIVLALIMISMGHQAPASPQMTCNTVNAATICHF